MYKSLLKLRYLKVLIASLIFYLFSFIFLSGNVKAVLVRGNRPYTLTRDHTPYNKKEKNRVVKDGKSLGHNLVHFFKRLFAF